MLVLTRKVGEAVKIDENIFVRVIQVKGKQVRIGIEAPRETKIQREELTQESPTKETSAPTPSTVTPKVSSVDSSSDSKKT